MSERPNPDYCPTCSVVGKLCSGCKRDRLRVAYEATARREESLAVQLGEMRADRDNLLYQIRQFEVDREHMLNLEDTLCHVSGVARALRDACYVKDHALREEAVVSVEGENLWLIGVSDETPATEDTPDA